MDWVSILVTIVVVELLSAAYMAFEIRSLRQAPEPARKDPLPR